MGTLHRLLLASLALACAGAGMAAEPPLSPSRGLFVKLKERAVQEAAAHPLHAAASPAWADDGDVRRALVQKVIERRLGHTGQARSMNAMRETAAAQAAVKAVTRRVHLVDWGRPLDPWDAARLASQLEQDPDVEFVEYNLRERRLEVVPNDPQYVRQWWLRAGSSASAGVPRLSVAWDTSAQLKAPQSPVAVLDTGKTSHPDLNGQWLAGWDFVGDDNDATDPGYIRTASCEQTDPSSWHGTSTAGIIAARGDDGYGVAGVNWKVPVVPVRIADECGAWVDDIVKGMRWAAGIPVTGTASNPNPPARVINLSFGGPGECSQTYREAINELRGRGAVLVVAAGNEATAVARPANCPGVVAVAAVNKNGVKTSYSNFGPQVTISTVGGDPSSLGVCGSDLGDGGLWTTSNSGLEEAKSPSETAVAGTSFSAPIVSGVLSLMLAVNPALTVDQLIDGLRRSARPHVQAPALGTCWAGNHEHCACSTTTCGVGLVDAPEALRYAADPAGYTPAPWSAEVAGGAAIESCAQLKRAAGIPLNPPAPAATPAGGDGGGALHASHLALLALAGAVAFVRGRRGQQRMSVRA